jgi:hypothetical protein
MPALPDHPAVLRIDWLLYVASDLSARCRSHLTYTGTAPTNAVCVAYATALRTLWVAEILPYTSTDNGILGVKVTDLTSPTAGVGEFLSTTGGGDANAANAAEVCVLVNEPIARRYRGGKPRLYIPAGTSADLVNPQLWSNTFISNFQASLDALYADMKALSISGTIAADVVSVSDYLGFTAVTNPITGRTRDVPKVRAVAIAPDIISALDMNPKPGSQRRRQLHAP